MLTVSNLSKRYGNVLALQNVSFHIQKKESAGIFSAAGPAGPALCGLLSGLCECRPGQICIGGLDMGKAAEKARALVGYLPKGNPLYGDMSVLEYLEFVCSLYKIPGKKRRARAEQALELCALAGQRDALIRDLSALDARRAGIAGATVFGPSLLLLSQPTFALRTEDAEQIRALLAKLQGTYTLLLLTDSITEITELCRHIIILNRGRVVSDSSLSDLAATTGGNNRLKLRMVGAPADLQALFALLPGILDVNFQRTFEPGTVDVLLEVRRGTDLRRDIWALAAKAQLPILEMRPISVSLEDVFLQLTGSGGGGL